MNEKTFATEVVKTEFQSFNLNFVKGGGKLTFQLAVQPRPGGGGCGWEGQEGGDGLGRGRPRPLGPLLVAEAEGVARGGLGVVAGCRHPRPPAVLRPAPRPASVLLLNISGNQFIAKLADRKVSLTLWDCLVKSITSMLFLAFSSSFLKGCAID